MSGENEDIKPLLSEEEILEYHTALFLLEGVLLDICHGDDISKVVKDFLKNTSFSNSKCPQNILSILLQAEKQISNKSLPTEDHAEILRKSIHLERQKYDKDYFSIILKGDTDKLKDAREFIETLKEEDTFDYNITLATLFSCFKELAQEKTETIERARKAINFVIDDYKIEKVENKNKSWAERYFDRLLFHGSLCQIEETSPTKKKTPISASFAAKIAPESSIKCLQKLQEKYNNPDVPEYQNAQNLLTIFNHVMTENHMEYKPFPLLINKVYHELARGSDTIPFLVVSTDLYGKQILDSNRMPKYVANDVWENYCLRKRLPYKKMGPGLKHLHKQELLSNTNFRNAICNEIEWYLIDFCDKNGLNSDVVKAVFGLHKKYDTQGNLTQSYYDEMYRYLFKTPFKDDRGRSHKALFHAEMHHDRERIAFSPNPNQRSEMILTINPNKDLGFNAIYTQLLRSIEHLTPNSEFEKIMATYQAQKSNLPTFNFHQDILHGGDFNSRDDVSQKTLSYFVTPERPDGRHFIMMIDTDTRILDGDEIRPPVTKRQADRAMRNLRIPERL